MNTVQNFFFQLIGERWWWICSRSMEEYDETPNKARERGIWRIRYKTKIKTEDTVLSSIDNIGTVVWYMLGNHII